MGDGNWLSRGIRRKSGGKPRGKRHSQPAQAPVMRGTLGIEQLEDRRVLATFLVTNFNDVDGGGATILGSLRWAIESANANADRDIIVFAETAWTIPGANQTINLNGGTLAIEQPVDIMGPGARKLTVQQNRVNQRVFDIAIEGHEAITFSPFLASVWVAHHKVAKGYCLARFNADGVCPRTGRVGTWDCVDTQLETSSANADCECELKHTRGYFSHGNGRYAFIPAPVEHHHDDDCSGFAKENREYIEKIAKGVKVPKSGIDCPTSPYI